jgi:predicted nucleic acid-binding protein
VRLFLDANILFSAAKAPGAVERLVALLLDARHECWVDDYVITEARRNLEMKAPGGLTALDGLLKRLRVAPAQPRVPDLEASVLLAENDRPILAAAIRLACDALVTGDRTHFGRLYGRRVRGVATHSPRSLAEELWGPAGPRRE